MIFKPAQLGMAKLDPQELEADKKACRKIGPCGVGKKALYLNSFYIDRRYYLPYGSITRVFKRATIPGWTLEKDGEYPLDFTYPAAFADDQLISGYARESVYFMVANSIINGVGGNCFAPKNTTSAQEAQHYANATREQALAIAVRMVENLNI